MERCGGPFLVVRMARRMCTRLWKVLFVVVLCAIIYHFEVKRTNSSGEAAKETVPSEQLLWRQDAKDKPSVSAPGSDRKRGDVQDVKVFDAKGEQSCKHHLPLQVPRTLDSYKICTYDPHVDYWVSGTIMREGNWEADLIEQALDFMEKAEPGSKEGVSLVDIGCNIGVFALSVAAKGYKVLAVDAMEASLQLLATSLRLADLRSRVTMLHNAISNKHETITMRVDPRNVGGSFMVRGKSGDAHTTQVVKAVCLDDLVPHVATRRVFVKMDIEMSEWLALQCADNFFSQLDVVYFMMEWAGYAPREHADKGQVIISFMTERGYLPVSATDVSVHLTPEKRSTWPSNIIWIKHQAL